MRADLEHDLGVLGERYVARRRDGSGAVDVDRHVAPRGAVNEAIRRSDNDSPHVRKRSASVTAGPGRR